MRGNGLDTRRSTMNDIITADKTYTAFFHEVKNKVQETRIEIYRKTNRKLIQFYMWLGAQIVLKQVQHGWGKAVVEQLSKDMKIAFPDAKGFSTRNLWLMRQFYTEYRDKEILQQLVAELLAEYEV